MGSFWVAGEGKGAQGGHRECFTQFYTFFTKPGGGRRLKPRQRTVKKVIETSPR